MLDSATYENVGNFVKALGHEKRLQLIDLLRDDERCVEDLSNAMGIGVKSVSAHLRVMRTHGVLTTRRDGNRVYYRVRNTEILDLYRHIVDVALLNNWRTITATSFGEI